ncbi:aldo/keto reductase [Allomeiothermus silvanus DSM 9946]|uniref:Aldo/keto reductase n=1 Tax=Allomeiothermus silvanus (strain ATCC 700542 / DSM 9946 / NBRC 106475 / NCIMB 13440 / VI-R2) TaxID=526227 RepID=D7BI89_ALLS1|nr:aldo/keto reductase [Allomeiothermus silvanus]ADH62363.1 aldo/keto reductase [Allomeiothermus silvanus DSM 9946]
MQTRSFGRLGWPVSEIGYGMWGLAGWTGSDEEEVRQALQRAVELGINFFDTAWAYGEGKSERMLGELVRANPDKKLWTASKIPAKNFKWPARAEYTLDETYPPDHIRRYTEWSLENLGLASLDLMQFHVWHDNWAQDERWQREVQKLREEGLVRAWGISINRWEPGNAIEALKTGLIDAVQVIYNLFDQNPEDELLPFCQEHGIAVIARVPFDEGSLTGMLTPDTTFPEGDWRSRYFTKENLIPTLERVERVKADLPQGMTLPELALRFILQNPTVSTVIPGMRRVRHVEANVAVSDGKRLPDELMQRLKAHRWVRQPTPWSD